MINRVGEYVTGFLIKLFYKRLNFVLNGATFIQSHKSQRHILHIKYVPTYDFIDFNLYNLNIIS
jgi:hypothetical protein